jgi:hypothetical protein
MAAPVAVSCAGALGTVGRAASIAASITVLTIAPKIFTARCNIFCFTILSLTCFSVKLGGNSLKTFSPRLIDMLVRLRRWSDNWNMQRGCQHAEFASDGK